MARGTPYDHTEGPWEVGDPPNFDTAVMYDYVNAASWCHYLLKNAGDILAQGCRRWAQRDLGARPGLKFWKGARVLGWAGRFRS